MDKPYFDIIFKYLIHTEAIDWKKSPDFFRATWIWAIDVSRSPAMHALPGQPGMFGPWGPDGISMGPPLSWHWMENEWKMTENYACHVSLFVDLKPFSCHDFPEVTGLMTRKSQHRRSQMRNVVSSEQVTQIISSKSLRCCSIHGGFLLSDHIAQYRKKRSLKFHGHLEFIHLHHSMNLEIFQWIHGFLIPHHLFPCFKPPVRCEVSHS